MVKWQGFKEAWTELLGVLPEDKNSAPISGNVHGNRAQRMLVSVVKQVTVYKDGSTWKVLSHTGRTEAAQTITTRDEISDNGELVFDPDFPVRQVYCDAGNLYYDLPHSTYAFEEFVAGAGQSKQVTRVWLGAGTTVTRIHLMG